MLLARGEDCGRKRSVESKIQKHPALSVPNSYQDSVNESQTRREQQTTSYRLWIRFKKKLVTLSPFERTAAEYIYIYIYIYIYARPVTTRLVSLTQHL